MLLFSVSSAAQVVPGSWQGTVRDAKGNVVAGAQVELRDTGSGHARTAVTDAQGGFHFPELLAGEYGVRVRWHNKTTASRELLKIQPGSHLNSSVQVAMPAEGWFSKRRRQQSSRKQVAGKNSPAGKFRSCP